MAAGVNPILLIGVAGAPGFAEIRTRQFAEAIKGAVGVGRFRFVDFRDDVATAVRAFAPEAVVTASNYGPTKAAIAALAGLDDLPFWLDVAGDPFAEAQAYAARVGGASAVAEDARRVWCAAYARADWFSAVCAPGRHAILGALGVLGRLPLFPAGEEPISVIPNAMAFGEPGIARRGGLRVVLIGGFNTWFDDETLLAGLLLAMAGGDVRVTVCGGAIPDHFSAGFERFERGALASKFAAKFSFPGWVSDSELSAIVAENDATIVMDRAGAEAELGSRTRILFALHAGLRVLATGRSPIAAKLGEESVIELVPAACEVGPERAAQALATSLLLARPAGSPESIARLREEYSVQRTAVSLTEWCCAPKRSARGNAVPVDAALLAENATLRRDLVELRESPTFRVLDRLKRGLS